MDRTMKTLGDEVFHQVVVIRPEGLIHGQYTVGTDAEALGSESDELLSGGIVLAASADNSGTIFIGNSGVSETTGYALAAGDKVPVSVKSLADIFVVSDEEDQLLYYLGS